MKKYGKCILHTKKRAFEGLCISEINFFHLFHVAFIIRNSRRNLRTLNVSGSDSFAQQNAQFRMGEREGENCARWFWFIIMHINSWPQKAQTQLEVGIIIAHQRMQRGNFSASTKLMRCGSEIWDDEICRPKSRAKKKLS